MVITQWAHQSGPSADNAPQTGQRLLQLPFPPLTFLFFLSSALLFPLQSSLHYHQGLNTLELAQASESQWDIIEGNERSLIIIPTDRKRKKKTLGNVVIFARPLDHFGKLSLHRRQCEVFVCVYMWGWKKEKHKNILKIHKNNRNLSASQTQRDYESLTQTNYFMFIWFRNTFYLQLWRLSFNSQLSPIRFLHKGL